MRWCSAGTATLGSYTTLSTWMLESHRLAQDDQLLAAAANLVGSLLIGFAAVAGRPCHRGGAVNEDCLKLTAYFAERDRSGGRFLGDALLEICERHALQTSVLLRGAEGFGRHQVLQSERLLSLSDDLPMVLAAVDTRQPDRGGAARGARRGGHGLLTLERARMLTRPDRAADAAGGSARRAEADHLLRPPRARGWSARRLWRSSICSAGIRV